MIIRNARVFVPECRFIRGSILIRGGMIERVLTEPYEEGGTAGDEVDASGCLAIPGLIDIHFHGCMGADFCDGTQEAIRTLAEYEARSGITAICPATLTLPADQLCRVLEAGAEFAKGQRRWKESAGNRRGHESGGGEPDDQRSNDRSLYDHELRDRYGSCADLVGVNMEGPFISRIRKGAQNEAYIIPCDEEVCRRFLISGDGLVKIIGIAPEETPGAAAFIRRMKDSVRVSLGHTNADYETAKAAFDAGASHVVHLFNAMPEFLHRAPGVAGAAADSPHVTAELIGDGWHVHESAVRGAFAMITPERLVLISDSLRATGLGDGVMDLGGLKVKVENGRAVLEEDGSLAGSVTNLMDCMRRVVTQMGIPLASAVRCATLNPARVIGEEGRRGSLRAGRIADVVLLDERDLSVRAVFKDGRRLV